MKLKEMLSDYQLGKRNWDGEQIITGITDSSRDIMEGIICRHRWL